VNNEILGERKQFSASQLNQYEIAWVQTIQGGCWALWK